MLLRSGLLLSALVPSLALTLVQPTRTRWIGIVGDERGFDALTIVVTSSGSSASATVSIPRESVADLQAANAALRGDSLWVTIRPGRAIAGRIVGDSLDARFAIDDRSVPAVFGREGSPLAVRLQALIDAHVPPPKAAHAPRGTTEQDASGHHRTTPVVRGVEQRA